MHPEIRASQRGGRKPAVAEIAPIVTISSFTLLGTTIGLSPEFARSAPDEVGWFEIWFLACTTFSGLVAGIISRDTFGWPGVRGVLFAIVGGSIGPLVGAFLAGIFCGPVVVGIFLVGLYSFLIGPILFLGLAFKHGEAATLIWCWFAVTHVIVWLIRKMTE